MPVQEPQQALSPDQIRTQLQKVLASPRFQRAPRQSRLLHYLVEAALRGNRPGLTEAVIAREAFDRTAGFDPSSNREVATTVGRLRKSLESYHRTDGLQDSVEIQLPLGSHLPVVCPSGRAAEAAASPQPIPVRSSADPRPGPAGQPIDFRIDVSTLVVLEAQGREVGRKQFDAPLAQEAYRGTDHISRCAFADVDRDGAVEILFVEVPQYWGNTGMKLWCLSGSGQVRWSFEPGRPHLTDGQRSYVPPYFISNVHVLSLPSEHAPRILVSSNHHLHNPNQIALLKPRHGDVASEYWHSGHLLFAAQADLNGDGVEELLLAGVNNGYRQATLVIFDPRCIKGSSSQPRIRIRGFPAGTERAVILFPRTCLSADAPYNRVVDLRITSHRRIMVMVAEHYSADSGPGVVIYELSFDLKLISVEPDSHLRHCHTMREAEGLAGHTLEDELKQLTLRRLK
jgi:hypothetical protein